MKYLKNIRGFSLVEMIVVMLLFVIVIGITGDAFNKIVSRSLAISKSSESNIAGVVGLEMMRTDIESAGYGLPWSFSTPISYKELATTVEPGVRLNDTEGHAPDGIPRALLSVDVTDSADQTMLFNTDVLAVRSLNVATNATSRRWTYVMTPQPSNPTPTAHVWSTASDNLVNTDKVIMIKPQSATSSINQLVVTGGDWWKTFSNYSQLGPPSVRDDQIAEAYMLYGVDGDTDLTMPFNRADYYIRQPASSEHAWVRLSQKCNPASGILFKGVVPQAVSNGSKNSYVELPLLGCVLDMRVVYTVRNPTTGVVSDYSDLLSPFSSASVTSLDNVTAAMIRENVKGVKVYILTHDGGMDRSYTYPNSTIRVGDPVTSTGKVYDFVARGVPNWQNYRWKVYRIVARPGNLAPNPNP